MCTTMSQYDAQHNEYNNTVGSFTQDRAQDFYQNVINISESISSQYSLDVMSDITKILKVPQVREDYKQQLLGDVVQEGHFGDKYYDMLPSKMEQLFENTADEMVRESSVFQLSPVVGITLPVLKKNWLECHAKDIVMTEVPTKPIVKAQFERKFLKDRDGNKYYIPEVFYNDKYKEIMAQGMGKPIEGSFYPVPTMDLGILELSGGTMQTRDTLGFDFHIRAVKIKTKKTDGTEQIKVIDGLEIKPNTAADNSFMARVTAENEDGTKVEDIISGQVDQYAGKVSVSVSGGKITEVQFGGHLSNENNVQSIDLDRERKTMEWIIPEQTRINTGVTIERVKDFRALLNIDLVSEFIGDITTTLTQYEDSTILDYLDKQLQQWKGKKELPFGYSDGFVESYEFSLTPVTNAYNTQSMYISTELPFRLNRELVALKNKLKTEEIMFVIYANPEHITLLQDNIKWIINDDTKIGGIQLEYKFGVVTGIQDRAHVVSSLKVPKDVGFRIVAYPTSKNNITFKHYKYSFNIENSYKNPMTPLTPNIMGTSRFLTTHVLPVQGEFLLTNSDFGRKTT
ncbi:hypothetical protein D1872_38350 [compost metagenome]